MDLSKQHLLVIRGYETLSNLQQEQFKRVIAQGLRGKFIGTLGNDTDAVLSIIDVWIHYGFLPINRAFSAVNADSQEVVAILLLNDFYQPDALKSTQCLLSVMRVIGIKKALKIAFQFLAVDNMNKETNSENIVSEIYLVSTLTSARGNGIGTYLIKYVLDDLHSTYSSTPESDVGQRVKLLVFEKNPAIHLYRRLGFIQTSSVATPKIARAFGDAYDALVQMERSI